MNKGFEYREVIDGRGEGRALLDYLCSRYRHTEAEQWRERIDEGRVLLGGVPVRMDHVLRRGQVLSWVRPPWDEPEAPLVYAILFQDDALLVVAKPSGLPTLPGGGFLENTLIALVRRRCPEASPVHRLGRGTSGLVLFARTAEVGRALSHAWREKRVTKTYRALVSGHPASDAFLVEAPIGPVPHPGLGSVHASNALGKASRSWVRVIERRSGACLVEVDIETGRPHQIRIHMAACGHPLVGDPLYAAGGGLLGHGTALPGDGGYLLHAYRLGLPHPVTGECLRVECRPPRALRSAAERGGNP